MYMMFFKNKVDHDNYFISLFIKKLRAPEYRLFEIIQLLLEIFSNITKNNISTYKLKYN